MNLGCHLLQLFLRPLKLLLEKRRHPLLLLHLVPHFERQCFQFLLRLSVRRFRLISLALQPLLLLQNRLHFVVHLLVHLIDPSARFDTDHPVRFLRLPEQRRFLVLECLLRLVAPSREIGDDLLK